MIDEPQKGLLKGGQIKVGFVILGVIALGLLLVWGRAFYGSWKAFEEGEAFLKKGENIRAITFFDRSIHWYTPFNPYVEKSAQRLWEIGEQAEKQGDIKLSLIAFRTIRGGFYAARSLYTPGKEWIRKSDAKIHIMEEAELKARIQGSDTRQALGSVPKVQETVGPDPIWSLVVVTSFLGWVGSVIAIIIFLFARREKPVLRSKLALLCISLAAIFFAFWILGMVKA